MRRDSPFVQVYDVDKGTVVHIHQMIYCGDRAMPSESPDGVVVSLEEFRSLMFHLRALDAQFAQGAAAMENNSAIVKQTKLSNDRVEDHASAGQRKQKRVWSDMTGDDDVSDKNVVKRTAARVANDKPLQRNQTDAGAAIASDSVDGGEAHTWHDVRNEMNNMLTALKPSDVADVPVVTNVTHVPKPFHAMTASSVLDELAIVYAEEVIDLLPHVVYNACDGCKNGADKNTAADQHAACTLPRKRRIDLFAESTVLVANESLVHDKLTARLQSRRKVFNADWMHVDRHALLANKKWMSKMK